MRRCTCNRGVLGAAVLWLSGGTVWAGDPVVPGTVIFDFDTRTTCCDPDSWSFFGNPTTDFGPTTQTEDGHVDTPARLCCALR